MTSLEGCPGSYDHSAIGNALSGLVSLIAGCIEAVIGAITSVSRFPFFSQFQQRLTIGAGVCGNLCLYW